MGRTKRGSDDHVIRSSPWSVTDLPRSLHWFSDPARPGMNASRDLWMPSGTLSSTTDLASTLSRARSQRLGTDHGRGGSRPTTAAVIALMPVAMVGAVSG
jgi:hypothetical protein